MKSTKVRVMKRCCLPAALMLLMIGIVLTPRARAQEQQTRANQKISASLTGQVTVHGKGQSGIVVKLVRLDPSIPRAEFGSATGEDGSYRFGDLPAATYQVQLVSEDFFLADDRGLKILVVGVGEHLKDVDFEMLPGAVISGRVLDAKGHPLASRLVTLLVPKAQPAKEGALMPAGGLASTDAKGTYQIHGAAPGRYFVGVRGLLKNDLTAPPSLCSEAFYPGVIDSAKAIAVEIREGQQVTKIDIMVSVDSCFSASGQVIDGEIGAPLAHARLGITKVEGGRMNDFAAEFVSADDNGKFKIGGLSPGGYSLALQPADTDKAYAEPLEFEVDDQNITGLTITTLPGASISGSIVIEGTLDENLRAKLSQLLLGASVETGRPGPRGGNLGPIRPDGTFTVGGLPSGDLSFQLASRTSIKRDFVLLRTERNGVEQPRSIPLKANEQITDLKVIVAYGTGSIRGAAKYENGVPRISTANVALFWPDGTRELMWSPVDVRGNFLLEGIPAGSYLLELRAYSPEFQRMLRARKQLQVADGAAVDVTLTLDLSATPPVKTGP